MWEFYSGSNEKGSKKSNSNWIGGCNKCDLITLTEEFIKLTQSQERYF